LECGQARPGASLASLKIDMRSFCQEFNNKTKNTPGKQVNVKITVFKDRSYQFDIKGASTSELIKETIGEKKTINSEELEKIVRQKLNYLNTDDLEKAKNIISGTARSAGIKFV
jgi:large subunit ribosomal protein L11